MFCWHLQRLMWVKECFQRRDHITVFNLDGGDADSSRDIDVAILQALLKGKSDENAFAPKKTTTPPVNIP